MSYTNYQQEEENTIGIQSLLWHVAFLRMHVYDKTMLTEHTDIL